VTVVALLIAVGMLGWDLTDTWRNTPALSGDLIAVPNAGGISLVEPSGGRSRELVPSAANASVTAMAWSPDRATLAYSLFHRRPEDRVSSAELFTIPAAGGTATRIVERQQAGTIVDAPAWSPDGRAIYFAYQGVENGRPVARVEQFTIGSGERRPLYDDASFPTVSSDGRSLAFMYDDGSGQALRVGSVDGGDAREIVAATGFRGLMGPRFSPDGQWIAFVAVGPGPTGDAAPGPAGASDRPRPTGIAAWLTVPVASAHGEPWGIWKIRPDGRDLQPMTTLQEDEPLLAWSKDGAYLAVLGSGGLWIVDTRGTVEPRRIADGAIGGIDW
jgi:Tol biopolymer transport system component